jgi:cell division septal protein FtsQ
VQLVAPPSRARSRAQPERWKVLRRVPGGRAALAVAAFATLAAGAYLIARETSIFAVRTLDIAGGSPRVQQELRSALAPELGRSLLRIDAGEVNRRVASLPDVISVSFDRRFPHTLHIRVTAERPVLLLRRGKDGTWLVSARGRVMRQLRTPKLSSLPRVWVPTSTSVSVGATLAPKDGGLAAAALAPLGRGTFPAPVRFIRETGSELTLVLRSGLQIRLGGLGDLRLKLAIARRILRAVGADSASTGYLDVSVPERPVIAGSNAQVSAGG